VASGCGEGAGTIRIEIIDQLIELIELAPPDGDKKDKTKNRIGGAAHLLVFSRGSFDSPLWLVDRVAFSPDN